MSTLQENLDAIKLDKDTNLKPENLKAGITCLGVNGTLTQNVVFDPSKIVTTSTSTSDINLLKKCIIKFNDIVLDFSGSKNTAYLFDKNTNLS